MSIENPSPILSGYKALIVGIANEDSIAYGCAKAFRAVGADVAVTYLNELIQIGNSYISAYGAESFWHNHKQSNPHWRYLQ